MLQKKFIRTDNLGNDIYKITECECGANDWFSVAGEYKCCYCDAIFGVNRFWVDQLCAALSVAEQRAADAERERDNLRELCAEKTDFIDSLMRDLRQYQKWIAGMKNCENCQYYDNCDGNYDEDCKLWTIADHIADASGMIDHIRDTTKVISDHFRETTKMVCPECARIKSLAGKQYAPGDKLSRQGV